MQKNKKDMRLNLNNFEAYVILKTEKEGVPGGTAAWDIRLSAKPMELPFLMQKS